MFFTLGAMAQTAEPAQKTFWDDPVNDPLLPVYLLTAFVFIVIVLVAFVAHLSYQDSQHARCTRLNRRRLRGWEKLCAESYLVAEVS